MFGEGGAQLAVNKLGFLMFYLNLTELSNLPLSGAAQSFPPVWLSALGWTLAFLGDI